MRSDSTLRPAPLSSGATRRCPHLVAVALGPTPQELSRASAAIYAYDDFDRSSHLLDADDVLERPEQALLGGRTERGCAVCGYDDRSLLARASTRLGGYRLGGRRPERAGGGAVEPAVSARLLAERGRHGDRGMSLGL